MLDDNNNEINSFLRSDQRLPDNMNEEKPRGPKKVLVVLMVLVFTGLVAFLFYKFQTRTNDHNPTEATTQNDGTDVSKLPIETKQEENASSSELLANETSNEKLTFGTFYRKQDFVYKQIDSAYSLPINIKSDTTNYYDFSRKINLDDDTVNQLNKNGFAIVKAASTGKKNDFWSTYQKLTNLDVPIMVTNDFLLYYFQNNIKSIYKDIEQSVFYDNLWDLNMTMYNTALARYRALLNVDHAENSILSESARLQLTFFATGLKLLEPKSSQISDAKLIDENKFSLQEAKKYSFDLPEYLQNGTIERELALISAAKGEQKSPIFFYKNSYAKFQVPGAYSNNAKLNNFYLATEWMRMEFPLYYKSSECPDCLLDADDWKINFGAASFIANDLYQNLELKNKWAIIYKFISFFSGLRNDYTFLNYNQALNNLFGKNYNLEDIISIKNPNLQDNLSSIQNELSNNSFSDIEGSYPRNNNNKKYLGMRLLQDYFWPNDYIFDYLSGVDMLKSSNLEKALITDCGVGNNGVYRCSGFGLDIVNLLQPIDKDYSNFNYNKFAYPTYQNRSDKISQQIASFDVNNWNNNLYWMTLDTAKTLLVGNGKTTYDNNPLWSVNKDYNTVLGAWVDIHLSGDEFVNYENNNTLDGGLIGGVLCNKDNFVEQDIEFVNELISKSEMLIEMTNALGVSKNTNAVSLKLRSMTNDLKRFREIEKKEAEGVALIDDDCRYIKSFVKNYSVNEGGSNFFVINQKNSSIKESNEGVKLLFVVNQDMEGKKTISVGPIYNYQESRLR